MKSSQAVPDVAAHIERTVSEPNAQVPLSPDAYARFRRALGKLLWMAQVRHDIKIYLSLIGSQQATPMAGTESALRALLRYHMHCNPCHSKQSLWQHSVPRFGRSLYGQPWIYPYGVGLRKCPCFDCRKGCAQEVPTHRN